jgi:hypothetical protein
LSGSGSGSGVAAGTGDGVEDGIDSGDGIDVAGRSGDVTGMWAGVCVGPGVCTIWGVQVWVFKFGWSGLGIV